MGPSENHELRRSREGARASTRAAGGCRYREGWAGCSTCGRWQERLDLGRVAWRSGLVLSQRRCAAGLEELGSCTWPGDGRAPRGRIDQGDWGSLARTMSRQPASSFGARLAEICGVAAGNAGSCFAAEIRGPESPRMTGSPESLGVVSRSERGGTGCGRIYAARTSYGHGSPAEYKWVSCGPCTLRTRGRQSPPPTHRGVRTRELTARRLRQSRSWFRSRRHIGGWGGRLARLYGRHLRRGNRPSKNGQALMVQLVELTRLRPSRSRSSPMASTARAKRGGTIVHDESKDDGQRSPYYRNPNLGRRLRHIVVHNDCYAKVNDPDLHRPKSSKTTRNLPPRAIVHPLRDRIGPCRADLSKNDD